MDQTVDQVLERLSAKDFPHDPLIAEFITNHRESYIFLSEKMGGTKVSIPKISTLVGRILAREEREQKLAAVK